MIEKRVELHQSHLVQFEMCGEAYRRRYVEGEKDYAGTAALRGSGVHGGAQVNHIQKKKTGHDLPKKDIVDASIAAFEKRKADEGFRLTPDEQSMGVSSALARTVQSITTLSGLYADQVAPEIKPDLIEEKIIVEIPGTGIDLAGTIDLSTTDGRLKDFKTSTRSKSQKDADESLQLSLYDFLFEKKTGRKPTGLDLEVLVDLKTPKAQRLSTMRTQRDRTVLFNRMNVLLKSRQAGIFAPAAVGSWNCSAKWCGFWDTCPFVNGERIAASAKNED